MTISAIFDDDGDKFLELAFKHAVDTVNRNRDILPGVELKPVIEKVRPDDTFAAEQKTCMLLEKSTVAIFGPRSRANSEHIRSITDSVEVPYIETRWNYRPQAAMGSGGDYAFNLHPDITTLGSAYMDILNEYSWKTITILYQDGDSMMTLKEIFAHTATAAPDQEFRLVVKQLIYNENGYRDVLKEVFLSESNFIILDCEKYILEEVLQQCQQVGLISQGYYFLLTSLDAHTVNLDNYKHGGTNFTAFRMIDINKPEIQNVIYNIVTSALLESGRNEIPQDAKLDTATALIFDSVHAFAMALNELSAVQQVVPRPLDCSGTNSWPHGNSLINYMKMVEFVGLSGPIKLDQNGMRTEFAMTLQELQIQELAKIGTWNTLDRLVIGREVKDDGNMGDVHPMANKTFVITAVLNPPFTMLVESEEKLSGNARFEGFTVDLAAALSSQLHFNFTFKLVDDGNYGSEVSPGNWNGMIGEVLDGRADFAIADISITSKRASAVSFSMPWMNLGISILYVQPRPAPPSMLAFLDPFTTDVYVYTILVFVFVTLIIYVLARFSPNQWEEPSNCIRDPEEYENQYTLLNSFWFVMGALMQQGSDVAPIALCVRFAAGMWFFFALIMISSYTANLAAFLTVETLQRPIESVEDLPNQNEIKYGAVKGGSTAGFFANSNVDTYARINEFMSGVHKAEVMMNGNPEGVDKVEESDGKYAFFVESSIITYLIERRCKLAQVGGLLDNKGYGIVTRPGTPYKDLLDNAILKLMEGGVLHKLRVKWWKQKRGGGACESKGGGGGVSPLGLDNVAGVFVVTILGCAIASVFAIIEFLVGTRQSAKDIGRSWVEEMSKELKFILKCHGNTKEVEVASESGSHSSHLSLEPESPPYIRKKAESNYKLRNGLDSGYGMAPKTPVSVVSPSIGSHHTNSLHSNLTDPYAGKDLRPRAEPEDISEDDEQSHVESNTGSRSARGGQTGSPGSFQGGGPSGGAISPKPNKGKNPFADEDESEAE